MYTSELVSPAVGQSGFTEVPHPVTQAYGATAVFHCQHPQADAISWSINDSEPNVYSAQPGCDRDVDGRSRCYLRMTANETTNNALIRCLAYTASLTRLGTTLPVQLLVQGNNLNA